MRQEGVGGDQAKSPARAGLTGPAPATRAARRPMHFRAPNFEPTIYVRSSQDPYILAGARGAASAEAAHACTHSRTHVDFFHGDGAHHSVMTAPRPAAVFFFMSAAELTGCTYDFDYKPPKPKINKVDVLTVRVWSIPLRARPHSVPKRRRLNHASDAVVLALAHRRPWRRNDAAGDGQGRSALCDSALSPVDTCPTSPPAAPGDPVRVDSRPGALLLLLHVKAEGGLHAPAEGRGGAGIRCGLVQPAVLCRINASLLLLLLYANPLGRLLLSFIFLETEKRALFLVLLALVLQGLLARRRAVGQGSSSQRRTSDT